MLGVDQLDETEQSSPDGFQFALYSKNTLSHRSSVYLRRRYSATVAWARILVASTTGRFVSSSA